ncbi:ESPR-type extended signal peptide-containing protein [Acidaminococcus sp. HCP3S3_G9_1]|uniref:ESPR-type extended signal peptide-containing protein n=1 Tax=Acidaminococcus sp. HCP3S3_G9_1 TaxID=3438732 RepID=UPI003F90E4DF
MNRIYKVIWSKVRNAYVVVSELAKSQGKDKSEKNGCAGRNGLKAGLLAFCMAGGLMVGEIQPVWAASVDAGTTSNGDANTLAVGSGSSATGKGALAVGGGSQASGDTAVALAWGSQALSDYAIAIGHSAHVGGSYTYAQDGSTSGIRGTAQNAIAIGNTAVANGKDDVVIGANNTAETPTASYVETNKTGAYAQGGRVIVGHDNSINGRSGNSTAIGSANTINAVHGIALGQNVQVGQKSGATGTKADKTSVMLEYENSMGIGVNAKSLSSNSIALGNGAVAGNERTTDIDTDWNGKGAIAIGETAQATGYYALGLGAESQSTGDRTVVLGHGTQASAQLATALGSEATASGARSTVVGEEASATATRAIAVGAKAKAAGRFAVAIGEEADGSGENGTAVGPEAKAQGKNSVAAGYQAAALSEGEIAIGTSAGNGDNRSNVNNAVSIGTSAHSREAGGVALGNAALANLGKSVAIGDSAKANNADSIAIGSGATANGSVGSIALGSNSSVGRAAGAAGGPRWSTSAAIGGRWYTWASAKNSTESTGGTWTSTIDPKSTVWQSNLGAVSIGTDGLSGTTYTRQLTGLAAGTQDTDAVNVAQWKNTMLATIGDAKEDSSNTRYGSDGVARNVTRLVDEYLTLTGAADNGTTLTKGQLTTDANIGTIVGDNKITFRLAKDLKSLDSVTAGNTKMESAGITITNSDSKKSITLDGTNGRAIIGGVTVGHVNDGDLETSTHTVVPAGNYAYNLTNTTWNPSTYVSGRAATEDQLYSLGTQVAGDINTINQVLGDGSFGLSADDDASTSTNLGSTIKVKGDGQNIATKVDGTDLQIELNKDLNLGANGSVTMGNTLLNGSGLTLSGADENSKIQISQGNVSMGGQQIHNVANGTENTDAVNLSQLNEVKNMAGKQTAITVEGGTKAGTDTYTGTNLQLKSSTDSNGLTTYDLKLNDNLNIGGAGKDGAPGQDGHMGINGADGNSGVAIDGKDGISIKGENGKDGVTIKGIDGKDGVDGAEGHIGLNGKDGITDIWTTAGTPGLNGKDGETMTRIVYKDPKGDTHEAATLDDGLKFGGDFGTASAVKLNKQVNVKGNAKNEADLTDGNIGVVSSQDSDNGQLLVKLNKDLNLGANGSVTMGNTLLNGSGLTLSGADENSKIQISQGNVSMGGQQIHNVANGTANTDAVNLSQLNEIKNAGVNGGFGLAADDGNSVKKNLGETVTVKGDGTNISTKVDNGAIQVELNKDIHLGMDGSVTAGETTINKDGVDTNQVKVGDITITKDGINGGQQQITNMGSGIHGQVYDTSTAGQENWNNAASVGDVHTIIGEEAGKVADAVKAKSGKNITVDADNKVNLNDDITLGDADDASKQVKIDGNKAQIILGGKTVLGNQNGGGANPDAGSYLTGLDNKNWDASNIQSGRAATEDQLKVVDDKISGGRKFTGDDGQQLTVGLGQDLSLTGGAQADNLSDGNIGVVKNGDSGLSVKLAKDLTGLTSVTTGNTTMTSDGITIKSSDSSKGGDIKLATGDISMGGSQIHDVAPGTQGTDAVNKNQLDSAVNQVGRSITKLDARVDRVGANAAALAALHPLDFDPDDKLDFAVGAGSYSGANAVSLGAFYRPNEDVMFSLGGSVGGGENMVNVGATFKLGQHNHVSNSRVAMAKEIRSLKELVAKQDGEMQQLKTLMNQMAGRTVLKVDKDTLFPDIPENHWAYDYVTKLAKAGIVEGYPDGEFKGDRMMTRYEFAALVYRAIMAGAGSNPALDQDGTLGRLVKEFDGELKYIRIDVIEKDKHGNPSIERVRTVEDSKKHYGK